MQNERKLLLSADKVRKIDTYGGDSQINKWSIKIPTPSKKKKNIQGKSEYDGQS